MLSAVFLLSPARCDSGEGGAGSPGAAAAPPGAAKRVMRVLVADDEDALRALLVEALQEEGLEVVEAVDGEDALRLATAERFDALVLDHRMPGLTGGEVYQQLRARGGAAPAILITAARGAEEIAATFGFRQVLPKPFDVDELLACIVRVASSAG